MKIHPNIRRWDREVFHILFTYFLWSLLFSENYKVDAKLDNPIELDIKDQTSFD